MTALAVWLRLHDPSQVSGLRNAGFDSLQRLWPRQSQAANVVLVDIDQASLQAQGQWPWPRDKLAGMVNNLGQLGAKAVVLDILFPEPDQLSPSHLMETVPEPDRLSDVRVPKDLEIALGATINDGATFRDNDQIFADALRATPSVAAALASNDQGKGSAAPKAKVVFTGRTVSAALNREAVALGNIPEIDGAAAGLGIINIDPAGNGGVARKLPLVWATGNDVSPSLALEALRVASDQPTIAVNGSAVDENIVSSVTVGTKKIPTADDGSIFVYYARQPFAASVSATKIIENDPRSDLSAAIKNKIVFIGSSAAGLHDLRQSSLGETIPGMQVHAQAVDQILNGQFLSRPDWIGGGEIAVIALVGLFFSFASLVLRPFVLSAVYVVLVAAGIGAAVYGFNNNGLLLDATMPLLATTAIFLMSLACKLLITDRQKRGLKLAFANYVPERVLAEIHKHPEAVRLGGESREITVMFIDVANFSALAEKLAPEILVQVTNRIFTLCTQAILESGGTVDGYIGDAVKAFWNAPLEMEEHQHKACLTAIAIQQGLAIVNKEPQLSAQLQQAGLEPLSLRIGIATGPAIVGNLGAHNRLAYSAIGEAVNLGARAEESCKHFKSSIVLAGPILGRTADLATLPCGRVRFKGASKPIECHAVFAALRDEAHRQADMVVYAFQTGTRILSPKSNPLYDGFLAHLPVRKADYAIET